MLGQGRLLYFVRELFYLRGRHPLCSSPSVLLFRVDLVDGFVRSCVDLIGKGGPNLLVPSGLFESITSPRFVPCVMDFRLRFWRT